MKSGHFNLLRTQEPFTSGCTRHAVWYISPDSYFVCGYTTPGACMCLSDFLRSQFGSPSGLFGSLFVAPFLNLTNIGLIRAGIELLEPERDDRVLDIGFGGGCSLLALAEKLP